VALALAAVMVVGAVNAAEIDGLRRLWHDLLAQEPHVLSPRRTRTAEQAVEAVEAALRRDPKADVARGIGAAVAAVAAADSGVREARTALAPALAARTRARDLEAAKRAPREWRDAEAVLVRAAEKLEAGRRDEAVRQADAAREQYDRLRMTALRGDVLAEAQAGMRRLEGQEGRRWVPRSSVRALDAVAAAEKLLRERGEADDAVRAAAARAVSEIAHAQYLLDRVRAACSGDPARLESNILEWEGSLQRTLEIAGIVPDFTRGMGPGLDAIELYTTKLVRERDAERAWSGSRSQAADSLRQALSALGDTLRARDAERAGLRRVQARQMRLERVQAAFDRAEGRVFLDGLDVVLRLSGLRFAPAAAALPPDAAPLLDKVAAVVAEYPGARIVVEGHTDGQGRPETNQTLSQQRADAVRAALVERGVVTAARATAVGRGSTRPIASETDESGREANRRIEIVIAPVD